MVGPAFSRWVCRFFWLSVCTFVWLSAAWSGRPSGGTAVSLSSFSPAVGSSVRLVVRLAVCRSLRLFVVWSVIWGRVTARGVIVSYQASCHQTFFYRTIATLGLPPRLIPTHPIGIRTTHTRAYCHQSGIPTRPTSNLNAPIPEICKKLYENRLFFKYGGKILWSGFFAR